MSQENLSLSTNLGLIANRAGHARETAPNILGFLARGIGIWWMGCVLVCATKERPHTMAPVCLLLICRISAWRKRDHLQPSATLIFVRLLLGPWIPGWCFCLV